MKAEPDGSRGWKGGLFGCLLTPHPLPCAIWLTLLHTHTCPNNICHPGGVGEVGPIFAQPLPVCHSTGCFAECGSLLGLG